MEKVTILSVRTGDSVKNVQDLKNNIKALKDGWTDMEGTVHKGLNELTIGSDEYKATLSELQVNQNALRDAMHGTAASFEQVTQAATMSNVVFDDNNKLVAQESISYNELVHTLADLKQAWRATTDETERAQLGEKINNVNNRLKEMDAGVGVFGRNVGNYKGALDSFAAGFGSMGKGAQAAIAPIKGATMGLQAMSKTPVIAILGLLVNILTKIIGALKSSEEGTQKLNVAMAPLKTIGDALTRVMQGLGDVIANLVGGFVKLATAIFGTNKATKERIKLAEQEKQMSQQARDTLIANAEAERDIAELRAKSADKLNYTAAERLEFLKQAGEKEKEIAARALQDAKLQYEIIKAKNALTKSSKEALDAEAQAYANLVKVETDYYNTIRTINSGVTRFTREEASAAVNAQKLKDEARKAELESYKALLTQEIALLQKGSEERLAKQKELLKREYDGAVANAKEKIKSEETLNRTLLALRKKYHQDIRLAEHDHEEALRNDRLLAMQNAADIAEKGTVENLRRLKDVRKAELDTLHREEMETDAEWNKRRIAAQWAYIEALQALNRKVVAETTDSLTLVYAESRHTQEQTLAYEQAMAEARVRQIETLGRELGETEAQYLARLAEARKKAADAADAVLDYEAQQQVLAQQNRMTMLEEGSLEYLGEAVTLARLERDTIHRTEEESDEEWRARQLEAERKYYDAKKALAQGYISTVQSMVGSVSSILGSLADIYDADAEANAEAAKKAKNLRIATATIDMLSGVVTAISQAQQLGPIAGPIAAAVNSAAVIAAGVANIAKIKAQQVSTGAAASATPDAAVPAQVSAPSIIPDVQQVRTVTGASEEERLNRMAGDRRVYILQSDIEAANERSRVTVDETTF